MEFHAQLGAIVAEHEREAELKRRRETALGEAEAQAYYDRWERVRSTFKSLTDGRAQRSFGIGMIAFRPIDAGERQMDEQPVRIMIEPAAFSTTIRSPLSFRVIQVETPDEEWGYRTGIPLGAVRVETNQSGLPTLYDLDQLVEFGEFLEGVTTLANPTESVNPQS